MYKTLITFLLFVIIPFDIMAQVTPTDGSALHYRVVGFSFPLRKEVARYGIEIASGNYDSEIDFQKNIIDTVSNKRNKIIADVPAFGSQYTWRIVYTDKHTVITKSELHHFSTLMDRRVDSENIRLRILVSAMPEEDMYVFIDATKTLYDMSGNAVWYIPQMNWLKANTSCHDLKCSSKGTITFMINDHACEINYNGGLLWEALQQEAADKKRKPGSINKYHTKFDRLLNGNYMALAMENEIWNVPGLVDSSQVRNKKKIAFYDNGKVHQFVTSGNLKEFDDKHNIVWSWSAADYYRNSDLFYRKRTNGLFDVGNTNDDAFCFDEKAKTIYISFGNINRIVKIKFPTGAVLNVFGALYEPGNLEMNNDLFCGQTDIRRAGNGYLLIYNNNTCNKLCGQFPSILMLQEPVSSKGQLKKIWEFECPVDELSETEQANLKFKTGGSVSELSDHSIFCCMGGNYSKVFIVNREKKMLWSALPEKWDAAENKWKPATGYHASIITRAQLESLIWGEPLKKR